MVFYPIRIRMCPNLLMVRPSQGHVLLIRLSHLMIRTCIEKQMDPSVRDNPQGTNTWELEGLRHRDTRDDDTTQHPMDSTTKLLEDHAELQVVHRELSLMAQQKSLDAVLHSHVVAMVGLLNLYLDGTLGYSWRRALEIAAKLEGHGTRHA